MALAKFLIFFRSFEALWNYVNVAFSLILDRMIIIILLFFLFFWKLLVIICCKERIPTILTKKYNFILKNYKRDSRDSISAGQGCCQKRSNYLHQNTQYCNEQNGFSEIRECLKMYLICKKNHGSVAVCAEEKFNAFTSLWTKSYHKIDKLKCLFKYTISLYLERLFRSFRENFAIVILILVTTFCTKKLSIRRKIDSLLSF